MANGQVALAETSVAAANATLTPIPATLTDAAGAAEAAEALAATAQFASTLSAFEAQRLSTRVPGLGQIPPTLANALEPAFAFATATQIALAYGHDDDVIQSFNGVEMVQVPPGCFWMGSSAFTDTTPITYICFERAFWIDRFEVTQAQFARLGGVKARPNEFEGAERPVDTITWFEARDFCVRRGARLPTEAEWEYAAAGPDSYPYPWGREFPENGENYAVYNRALESETVGPNTRLMGRSWVGAYDLTGNVLEWVNSQYTAYPYKLNDSRENDTATRNDVGRVLRGGSRVETSLAFLRTSFRFYIEPSQGFDDYGFRCARSS